MRELHAIHLFVQGKMRIIAIFIDLLDKYCNYMTTVKCRSCRRARTNERFEVSRSKGGLEATMYGSLERGCAGRPEFMESGEQPGMYAVPRKVARFLHVPGRTWSAAEMRGVPGCHRYVGSLKAPVPVWRS